MLSVHLRKDWREHRTPLWVLAAVLLLLAVGAGLTAPARLVPLDIEYWFIATAVGVGFLALTGDLVPGEARRGQLGLLLRSPGALRAAFWSKLVVLFGGLALLLGAGWAAGSLCDLLVGSDPTRGNLFMFASMPVAVGLLVAVILVTAPWAFAMSCWLGRGATVLPATAMLLAILTVPQVLVQQHYLFPVGTGDLAIAVLLLFGIGLWVAWASFVMRRRSGARSALVASVTALALGVLLPSWGFVGAGVHAWHRVDPNDGDVWIGDVILGEGGRFAFVNMGRNWRLSGHPRYTVLVDLDTGAWRQLGDTEGARFSQAGGLVGRALFRGDQHRPQSFVVRTEGARAELWDGRTGELQSVWDLSENEPELDEHVRDSIRDDLSLSLPDGTSAHVEGRELVLRDADGEERVPWPEHAYAAWGIGTGVYWPVGSALDEAPGRVFDLLQRRVIEIPQGRPLPFLRIGDSWVFRSYERSRSRQRATYWRFDEQSREMSRLDIPTGAVCGAAQEGQLLFSSPDGFQLMDPDTGETSEVNLVHWAGAQPEWLVDSSHDLGWTSTPGGKTVSRIRSDSRRGQAAYGCLEGSQLRCTTQYEFGYGLDRRLWIRFAGVPDEDSVIVTRGGRRIERWYFGSDRVDVLFEVGESLDR